MNDVNDEAVLAQEVGYRDEQLNEVDECAVKGATYTTFSDFWALLPPHIVEILLKYGTDIGNFSELWNIFTTFYNQYFLQTTLLKPDVTHNILNLPITNRQYDALLINRMAIQSSETKAFFHVRCWRVEEIFRGQPFLTYLSTILSLFNVNLHLHTIFHFCICYEDYPVRNVQLIGVDQIRFESISPDIMATAQCCCGDVWNGNPQYQTLLNCHCNNTKLDESKMFWPNPKI